MKAVNLCNFNDCFLCRRCLTDWLPAIAAQKKNFSLKKGEELFKEGDPVTGIFFVFEGAFKVHKRWDNQKELILRFARNGDVVGHLGLGDAPLYPISATALEPSVVCYLTLPFFESTLKVNSGLTYDLMRFFANELQESQKRMRDLAHMSVRARIAQALISLKTQFCLTESGDLNLQITRQDLASFAGTTYETLFKVANELTGQDVIAMSGKTIKILNEEALLKIINEDNL